MVRIAWKVPTDLESRYANHLVVQRTETEVSLMFFEARPPLLLGSPEERAAELQRLDSVDAVCVSKIVIPPSQFADFVRVMAQNLEMQTPVEEPKKSE